ncbi:MAG: hypothetical protein JXR19_01055 [Bacteroidia bacterium]
MKRFLYKILLILGISLFLGFVLESVIYINKSKSFTNGGSAINWTGGGAHSKVAFWGDSRVWAGINEFDSLSCVNLASAGVGYNVLMRKLENYLSNNNSFDILMVDYEILYKPNTNEWYHKSHFLKHLFFDHENLKSQFEEIKGSSIGDYYIPIIRYQGEFEQLTKDVIAYTHGSTNPKGFSIGSRPVFGDSTKRITYPYQKKMNLDDRELRSARIMHLNELARRFNFVWVPFYLPYSPNVTDIERPRYLQTDSSVYKIISPEGVAWSFSDFYDYRHLNEKGATMASQSLESQLLEMLNHPELFLPE